MKLNGSNTKHRQIQVWAVGAYSPTMIAATFFGAYLGAWSPNGDGVSGLLLI